MVPNSTIRFPTRWAWASSNASNYKMTVICPVRIIITILTIATMLTLAAPAFAAASWS